MAAMKVYPGSQSSAEIDVGHSSVTYRGGAHSSMTQDEMETQRNRMTLEEARWVGVRKKVPGMSGIPGKSRARIRSSGKSDFEEDPYRKVKFKVFF